MPTPPKASTPFNSSRLDPAPRRSSWGKSKQAVAGLAVASPRRISTGPGWWSGPAPGGLASVFRLTRPLSRPGSARAVGTCVLALAVARPPRGDGLSTGQPAITADADYVNNCLVSPSDISKVLTGLGRRLQDATRSAELTQW